MATRLRFSKLPKNHLSRRAASAEDTAENISNRESSVGLAGELKRISDFGCHVLTQTDESYPALLREIYDPPLVLYVKGAWAAKAKNAPAMVGSRMSGSPPPRATGRAGIDTAAHQGVLSAKGRTIAALGTGTNLVFPKKKP